MAKAKTLYVCQECGYEAAKWMGRCPACGAWNSFVEERTEKASGKARVPKMPTGRTGGAGAARAVRLQDVHTGPEDRLRTGVVELDRVMGGGIMRGSLTLIAGDPGIGKSTLMTELGKYLPDRRLLYVTGEESARQVKTRAERLGVESEDFLLLAETNVEDVAEAAYELEPDLLIVDSIQTIYRPDIQSAPGSVTQVRESSASLLQLAKTTGTPTFLVGHVTKSGSIAGPRVLEHMVDTVLYFEGERHHAYRLLRSVKNRFGAAGEIGVFEMTGSGLKEVDNPSALFLAERGYGVSGSAVVCALEGSRPILVEIQALVTPTSYGTPQRTATGVDYPRLQMLLGVLEKREGLRLSQHDVFVNVAGGVRLDEPAVDLGIVVAVASSFRDVPADSSTVLVGEVGLGGEVRRAGHLLPRLREAAKLGFERALVPQSSLDGLDVPDGLNVTGVGTVHEALDLTV